MNVFPKIERPDHISLPLRTYLHEDTLLHSPPRPPFGLAITIRYQPEGKITISTLKRLGISLCMA